MTTPNNKEEKCEACDALGSFGIIPKESHTCSKFVSPTPDSMEKKPGAYDTFDMDDVKEGRVECVVGDPTDSWVEIDEITETVNNTKYVEAKLAKEILSQVRQKAKEEVLRDIIVMETPTRGIEGETVMEYASSLGIDLSSNK